MSTEDEVKDPKIEELPEDVSAINYRQSTSFLVSQFTVLCRCLCLQQDSDDEPPALVDEAASTLALEEVMTRYF